MKLDRADRRKVLALVQRREIDAVLVTELSRRGRSTTDLLATHFPTVSYMEWLWE